MAVSQFDSSQMFPLFQLISPSRRIDMTEQKDQVDDLNHRQKQRSGRPAECVHKPHKAHPTEIAIHKSALEVRKHKSKHDEENALRTKVSRKQLMKQNEHIVIENQKLLEQLNNLQQTMNRKTAKLKDKLTAAQNINKEKSKENDDLKTHYQNLLASIEEHKNQLKTKQICLNCEEMKKLAKKLNTELGTTRINNKELNEDINMLKNVVYRLNVQLERYQDKLRKATSPNTATCNQNVSPLPEVRLEYGDIALEDNFIQESQENIPNHEDHPHIPISWGGVNSHTLGPLLDAYQDTIKEKEDIIKDYENELSNFTGKLKVIIGENEMLHKKINEESDTMKRNQTELDNAKEELKITKEQNDLLIKKCAIKQDKLQEIIKVYDQKVNTMKLDYEVLQEQYQKTRLENSGLQTKLQAISEAYEAMKADKQEVIPLTVHTSSVNECKRLFEELKLQYDNEKSKFSNQIKFLEQQSTELQKQVVDIGAEKRELQIKLKSSDKQLKKTEVKLVETSNSLTHVQISRDACKRQLNKAIQFGKELVNEQESLVKQLSNKHKENKAVKKLESNIFSRMDVLKTQLKAVQKDAYQELQSVEDRILEQDNSIENMKREHEMEVNRLLNDIKQKDECIAKLVDQSEAMPTYLLYRNKNV